MILFTVILRGYVKWLSYINAWKASPSTRIAWEGRQIRRQKLVTCFKDKEMKKRNLIVLEVWSLEEEKREVRTEFSSIFLCNTLFFVVAFDFLNL